MPWLRKIHKWASVIVGIQMLLWLLSGLYFNLMDHSKAAGRTYRSHVQSMAVLDAKTLLEPKTVLSHGYGGEQGITSLKILHLLDGYYYLLTHQKAPYRHLEHHYSLVNAYTGELVEIDAEFAQKLAQQSYNGPGEILSTKLLSPPIADFPKEQNAAWQINFADDINSTVYIDAGSGRIIGHSDDDKRLADIFFMLHFMDYGNQGSFNNIQVILFAFITLWLSFTGLIWTLDLGLRGQYQLKFFAKKQRVKLFDRHQKSLGSVKLSSHTNLLDGLIEQNIVLPSTCGGGGTCGRCKVLINPITQSTSADQLHFSKQELQQGYRLACQHFSNDVEHMTLIDVTDAKKHRLKLTASRFISPFIKELRFKLINEQSLPYKAGAFMRFFIPAAKGVAIPENLPEHLRSHWHHIDPIEYQHLDCTRSYSLAESSDTSAELVFTVKLQTALNNKMLPGVGSNFLCNLAIGQTVDALGPFEEFFAQANSQKTMVLLGAGSGMAPLKAIIEEQLRLTDENSRDIHFFYGARTEIDLIYADYFYQLAKRNSNFHYYPTLSQPSDSWSGARGYVQQVLASNWTNLADGNNSEFYLCGPQCMMNETISFLIAKGVRDSAIAFDTFI